MPSAGHPPAGSPQHGPAQPRPPPGVGPLPQHPCRRGLGRTLPLPGLPDQQDAGPGEAVKEEQDAQHVQAYQGQDIRVEEALVAAALPVEQGGHGQPSTAFPLT